MDEAIVVALPLAFATVVTAHVALVAGLARRRPRSRALMAAVAFPLAPFWGARSGMHARVVAWTFGAIAYAALRIAASR